VTTEFLDSVDFVKATMLPITPMDKVSLYREKLTKVSEFL